MTCIVWDGVTLISDSKVTVRAGKDEVRMGAYKTYVLDKPVLTKAGDKILAVTGAGRMDLIEFYQDKMAWAAKNDMTAEDLVKTIVEFSPPRCDTRVDIIGVGTNAAGTEARCFQIGRTLTPVTKPRVWGSGGDSNKEIIDAFLSVGSLAAAHGLSSIDHARCGLPFHEFNPLTRTSTTYHVVPEEKAVLARDILDAEFKKILDRIYVKPVGRRKAK